MGDEFLIIHKPLQKTLIDKIEDNGSKYILQVFCKDLPGIMEVIQ